MSARREVDAPTSGVMVIRIERQDEYLLITMVSERGQPDAASPEDRRATTDPAEALRVVGEFLDSF